MPNRQHEVAASVAELDSQAHQGFPLHRICFSNNNNS